MISLAAATPVLALFDMLGGSELLVIFLLVLVLFGGDKMPEFARGLAKVLRELRKATSGVEQEFRKAMEEEPPKPTPYVPPAPATPSIMPPTGTTENTTAAYPPYMTPETDDPSVDHDPLTGEPLPAPAPAPAPAAPAAPAAAPQSAAPTATPPAPAPATPPPAPPSGERHGG